MRVFIRVDANGSVGAGHLSRCSHLAATLRGMGAECVLIMDRDGLSPMPNLPECPRAPISARTLEEDAAETRRIVAEAGPAVLLVDSYRHGEEWERAVKPVAVKLVVWDDLADRRHACDLLVDCGAHRHEEDYRELVPPGTKLLLGSRYCPISPDIRNLPRGGSKSRRIHLFFGSADAGNLALEFYRESATQLPGYSAHVALSREPDTRLQGEWRAALRPGDTLFIGRPMGDSLRDCLFAIGAPGITTWERAYLGMYGFYVATQENQIDILRELEILGIGAYAGNVREGAGPIVAGIKRRLEGLDLETAGRRCSEMVDGRGLDRIAGEVLS